MTDPTTEAARELFGESLDELRKAVDGCSADELNRRPVGGDTNPLAVLVTHALYSTRSWLSLATGADLPPRDRPAEFQAVADDPAAFMASFDGVAAECREILAEDRAFDPSLERVPTWRFDEHDEGAHEPETAAWALIFALTHLREHVGHAQLTRQALLAPT